MDIVFVMICVTIGISFGVCRGWAKSKNIIANIKYINISNVAGMLNHILIAIKVIVDENKCKDLHNHDKLLMFRCKYIDRLKDIKKELESYDSDSSFDFIVTPCIWFIVLCEIIASIVLKKWYILIMLLTATAADIVVRVIFRKNTIQDKLDYIESCENEYFMNNQMIYTEDTADELPSDKTMEDLIYCSEYFLKDNIYYMVIDILTFAFLFSVSFIFQTLNSAN